MGVPDQCTLVNEAVEVGEDGINVEAPVPDCVNDLAMQLQVVFVLKTILGQIKEVYWPDIKRCVRRWRELHRDPVEGAGERAALSDGDDSPGGKLSFVEEQNLWESYEHPFPATFVDFQESATFPTSAIMRITTACCLTP